MASLACEQYAPALTHALVLSGSVGDGLADLRTLERPARSALRTRTALKIGGMAPMPTALAKIRGRMGTIFSEEFVFWIFVKV